MHFQNRTDAGVLLAEKFKTISLDKKNTVVIAIPNGGVPIAHEIATTFNLPMDIILVQKIGAPSYPELAIGSVSEDDEEFYNRELISELGYKHSDIDPIKEQLLNKLQTLGSVLRKGHHPLLLSYKDIILVDDGIDTGSTIESALLVLRKRSVRKIIIATPVASGDALEKIEKKVDKIVVLMTPNPIYSVGEWYEDFIPIEQEEVIKILCEHYPPKNKRNVNKDQNQSDIT